MDEKATELTTPTGLENVSVVMPEQTSKQDKKQQRHSGQKCLKILTVLVIFLVLTIATLIAMFFIFHHDDDDDDNNNNNVQTSGAFGGQSPKEELCTSRDCVVTAGIISQKMDPTVDPCQNFADYACGGYYKEFSLPRHLGRTGAFLETSEENYEVLREVLEEEVTAADPEYLVKLKDVYWSCVNEKNVGLQHFLNTSFARMWPTLNPDWDPASFDLNKSMVEYASQDIAPFWTINVNPHLLNSSLYTLYVALPTQFIIAKEHIAGPRNDSVLQALQALFENLAVELGADPEVARQDAVDVLDLYIRVAMTSEESHKGYYLSSIAYLQQQYDYFDFPAALQASFYKTGIQISGSQRILLSGLPYFKALEKVLNETKPRTIQNLFANAYAFVYLNKLTEGLRDVWFRFEKVAIGLRSPTPTWYNCINEMSLALWRGMTKEFVKRKMSEAEATKTYMEEMTDSVTAAFSDILDQADWITNITRTEAKQKLTKMARKLGYPEDNFRESDINDEYRDITFSKDDFFANRQILVPFFHKSTLKKLVDRVDKSKWEGHLIQANAFYQVHFNQILIPVGLMRPIFFSDNYPDSINYGGIGSIIGHEIIHGFENSGSRFDSDGNMRNWWQPEDKTEFDARIQCVIDQYNAFEHPQVELLLNGDKSVREAVADIVGVKVAFRAFKEKYESASQKEQPLSGLGLTTYQQFYVSYSQRFCQIHADEWLVYQILTAYHPPGRFRIIGTFQNDEDFGDIFNCSKGTYMNPIKKCIVW